MAPIWQLQTAKNKLSQVVDQAVADGPQIISRRGENTAVIISYQDYQKATGQQSRKKALTSCDISMLDVQRDASRTGRASTELFGA